MGAQLQEQGFWCCFTDRLNQSLQFHLFRLVNNKPFLTYTTNLQKELDISREGVLLLHVSLDQSRLCAYSHLLSLANTSEHLKTANCAWGKVTLKKWEITPERDGNHDCYSMKMGNLLKRGVCQFKRSALLGIESGARIRFDGIKNI